MKKPVGLPEIDEANRPEAPAMERPHHHAILRIDTFTMYHHRKRCSLDDQLQCDVYRRLAEAYKEQGGLCPVVPGHYSAAWNADHKLDLTFIEDLTPEEA